MIEMMTKTGEIQINDLNDFFPLSQRKCRVFVREWMNRNLTSNNNEIIEFLEFKIKDCDEKILKIEEEYANCTFPYFINEGIKKVQKVQNLKSKYQKNLGLMKT